MGKSDLDKILKIEFLYKYHIIYPMSRCFFFLTLSLCMVAPSSWAYLGGFEDDDGYTNDYSTTGPFGPGATNYNTNRYNAGAYGLSNGGPGGAPADIVDNSGLWQALDPVPLFGNRYTIAHAQTGPAHSYSGDSMLGMRNDTGSTANILMRYFMDDRDRDGQSYASSVGFAMAWSVRVCPDLPGAGAADAPAFNWTFRDRNLDAGFELGWNSANEIIYREAGVARWTTTGFALDHATYDRLDFSIDAIGRAWSLNAWDESTATSVQVVSGASLNASMEQVGVIDWTLAPNQAKQFFDESNFVVAPEPSSALFAAIGGLSGLARRRRRPVT
jgi:hypothetical protein